MTLSDITIGALQSARVKLIALGQPGCDQAAEEINAIVLAALHSSPVGAEESAETRVLSCGCRARPSLKVMSFCPKHEAVGAMRAYNDTESKRPGKVGRAHEAQQALLAWTPAQAEPPVSQGDLSVGGEHAASEQRQEAEAPRSHERGDQADGDVLPAVPAPGQLPEDSRGGQGVPLLSGGVVAAQAEPAAPFVVTGCEMRDPVVANTQKPSEPSGTALPTPAPAAPVGWQPIETAPKDADCLLLWADGYGVEPGYWHQNDEGGFWVSVETQGLTGGRAEPTHWQPLPVAPVAPARPPQE